MGLCLFRFRINKMVNPARRGIRPQDRVTITIDPERDSLFLGRKESRARVVAAGLTDKDIERLIEEAREEVQPHLE